MDEHFNGASEPMRALRDLIALCELTMRTDAHQETILQRARDGFTVLRRVFGDERPAEEIADAAMIEPRDMRSALQLTAGALSNVAPCIRLREQTEIRFNGAFAHFGTKTIKAILDQANEALEIS